MKSKSLTLLLIGRPPPGSRLLQEVFCECGLLKPERNFVKSRLIRDDERPVASSPDLAVVHTQPYQAFPVSEAPETFSLVLSHKNWLNSASALAIVT